MDQPQQNKGQFLSHNKIVIAIGFIMILLVMAMFSEIISALMKYSKFVAFLGGGVGVIAIVAIGVWFEKKSRRP